MANQGKHPKNPVMEWLEGEENTVPTKSRSSHVVDSYIKRSKIALKKSRAVFPSNGPPKPDALLLRESGPPPKADLKASQSASWDHQKRVGRLSQLRAPYQYKGR